MNKERIYYWDNLSGLFVFLVVLGHSFSFLGNGELGLYFYYLPFFFFKSGFLDKRKPFPIFMRTGGGYLLKSYIIYSFLSIVVYCLINLTIISPKNQILYIWEYGAVSANPPLWFLLTLFLVKCIATFLKINPIVTLIIALIITILGSYFSLSPYWVFNTCIGLFFFEIGILHKKYRMSNKLLYLLLIVLIAIIIVTGFPIHDVWKNELHQGNLFVWFIYMSIFSILITTLSSRYNKPLYIFNWIGRNSRQYLQCIG